jgi:hypothetical protein
MAHSAALRDVRSLTYPCADVQQLRGGPTNQQNCLPGWLDTAFQRSFWGHHQRLRSSPRCQEISVTIVSRFNLLEEGLGGLKQCRTGQRERSSGFRAAARRSPEGDAGVNDEAELKKLLAAPQDDPRPVQEAESGERGVHLHFLTITNTSVPFCASITITFAFLFSLVCLCPSDSYMQSFFADFTQITARPTSRGFLSLLLN